MQSATTSGKKQNSQSDVQKDETNLLYFLNSSDMPLVVAYERREVLFGGQRVFRATEPEGQNMQSVLGWGRGGGLFGIKHVGVNTSGHIDALITCAKPEINY